MKRRRRPRQHSIVTKRRALELRNQGRSYAEIAADLKVPSGTIGAWLADYRQRGVTSTFDGRWAVSPELRGKLEAAVAVRATGKSLRATSEAIGVPLGTLRSWLRGRAKRLRKPA